MLLSRLRIRSRILSLCAVPLIGLCWFAVGSLVEKHASLNVARTIGNMVDMAPTLSAFVDALEGERDSSVGYLVSQGKDFSDALSEQREATDATLKTYRSLGGASAHRHHTGAAHDMMQLTAQLSEQLADLETIRQKVDGHNIASAEAAAYYTDAIESLLRTIELTAKLSNQGHLIRTVVSYTGVLRGKEAASRERLAGIRGFAAGRFTPDLYRDFFVPAREQYVDLRLADRFDTHEDGALLRDIENDDTIGPVDQLRHAARMSVIGGGNVVASARDWYDASTARIEHLEQVAQDSAHHLIEHTTEAIEEAAVNYYISLISTIFTVCATLAFGAAVIASITRPIGGLVRDMTQLAKGDVSLEPEGVARRDEIGDMARAVVVFRDNARERNRLQEEARSEERERTARQEHVESLIGAFRGRIREMLLSVGTKMEQMKSTSAGLTAIASRASENAESMSRATDEASSNVSTVAQASDDLTASIREINLKVNETTKVVTTATEAARESNEKVSELAAGAQKIGNVLSLIREIAEQTNLLALNATIEAARAGEFGKGFAVVAAEVKTLANQTANATEEITRHIAAIQGSTGDAVNAIQSIAEVMTQVNQYTEAIAAAVEEQGAATEEIGRNVREAAHGTEKVAENAGGLSAAVSETDGSAHQLVEVSAQVSEVTSALRDEIETFLQKVAI